MLSPWATGALAALGSTTAEAQRALGVTPDGIVGPKTLRALWLRRRPSVDLIVARAILACEAARVTYKLGAGGWAWMPDATAVGAECDCSGFVAHVFGLPRNQADEAVDGPRWISTTHLVADGSGARRLVSALALSAVRPGDLVCYGDANGKQGHVGIVVKRGRGGRILTVDCSGSGGKSQSAVRRRDRTRLWHDKKATGLRPVWLE